MSVTVTFNGTSYTIPSQGDVEWAAALNTFLQALAHAIGPKGGTFAPATTGTVVTIPSPDISGRSLIVGTTNADNINCALKLCPRDTSPSGPNQLGDAYVTAAGVWMTCTVAGTPGTFVAIGSQS